MQLKQFGLTSALLVLSVLLAVPTASAQDVPVVTEDTTVATSQVGDSIKVPIEVSNLDSVSDIEAFQFDVQFPTDQLVFERIDISNTLVEESGFTVGQTDSSDANSSGTATFGGFNPDQPLNASGASGTLAKIVLTISGDQGGTVTFPPDKFEFENGRVPADLTDADFDVNVSTAPSTSDDTASTGENSSLSRSAPGVLGNDSDPDGDPLSVSAVEGASGQVGTQLTLASGALFTLNEDGSFTYDPNGQFEELADGESAVDSVNYTAADPAGLTDQGTLAITVNGMNDRPTVTDIADTSIVEDRATGAIEFTANDPETAPENLTVTATSGNADLVPRSGIALGGSGTDRTVTVTPAADSSGTADITVSVEDAGGKTSSTTFTLTVQGAIPISNARSQGAGASVIVEGTVTRALGGRAWMQDTSGTTGASGLLVEVPSGLDASSVQQGTNAQVAGTLSETSGGVLQFAAGDITDALVEGQGSLPAAQDVVLTDLVQNGEDYESELVRIEEVSFQNPDTTGGTFEANTTYTVVDDEGTTFGYRVGASAETELVGAPINPGTFTYVGVVGQSSSSHQLVPIRIETGLPVELANFEAERGDGEIRLQWSTASETNNAGFRIQRKVEESGTWTTIGRRDGAGTTTEAQTYRFTDANLPFEADELTYRLRQVDLDGSSQLSDPLTVERSGPETLRLLGTAPNPVRSQARVRYAVPKEAIQDSEVRLELFDVMGRKVRSYGVSGESGRHEQMMQVNDLSSGVYFLRLRTGDTAKTRKLTIVR